MRPRATYYAGRRPPKDSALLPLCLMGIALIAIGCGVQTAADNGSSSPLPIRFTEVARELGIDFISLHRDDVVDHICESMGSGAAWLDYDSDGAWDAYVWINMLTISTPSLLTATRPSNTV